MCVCPVNIREEEKKGFPGENLERLDGRVMRGRTGRGYASCGAVTTTLPYTQIKKRKTFFSYIFSPRKKYETSHTHTHTHYIIPCVLVAGPCFYLLQPSSPPVSTLLLTSAAAAAASFSF